MEQQIARPRVRKRRGRASLVSVVAGRRLGAVPRLARVQVIEGRRAISRVEIVERTGMSTTAVAYWYEHRDQTGHPQAIDPHARFLYWWEDQWTTWWENRDPRPDRVVDRSGEPDELVDASEFARILGWTSGSIAVTSRISRQQRQGTRPDRHPIPDPDLDDELPSGRQRRRWKRRTVWEFADGQVRPSPVAKGPRFDVRQLEQTRQAVRQAARDRDLLDASDLAQRLNVDEPVAKTLLAFAVPELIDELDLRTRTDLAPAGPGTPEYQRVGKILTRPGGPPPVVRVNRVLYYLGEDIDAAFHTGTL